MENNLYIELNKLKTDWVSTLNMSFLQNICDIYHENIYPPKDRLVQNEYGREMQSLLQAMPLSCAIRYFG